MMKLNFSSRSKRLLQLANAARDAGNWSEAAELYKDYIAASPNSFGASVQLGNCLKEDGRYEESLATYDAAIKLRPKDSDVFLQRGHVLKLMGRPAESLWSYQTAYDLDESNLHARHELENSGTLAVSSGGRESDAIDGLIKTIWLDVTDFMDYAKVNTSLSGIQRVLANLALHIRQFRSTEYRIVPVVPEYDRLRVLAVRPDQFLSLVDAFDDVIISREKLNQRIQQVYDGRVEVVPGDGDIFVMAGAFWIYHSYDVIKKLRRGGMRFGMFIHDLIQIRNHEYVMPDAVDKFQIQLCDALDVCDFILTNSQFVASEVVDYMRTGSNYQLPVAPVVLPTELKSHSGNIKIFNQDLIAISKQKYALCVSTIEIRKNHQFLIDTWERLREEFGEETPYLVLVGKWGWQIDSFRKYVDEKGYVGDWLFIYNGISDVEMEFLYKNSQFTIYPSFAEGFGLPIGESLVYGVPCIASNTTSMPEVGGDFVRYIDPFDVEASYPVFQKIVSDEVDLNEWRAKIKSDFKPKTWVDFCGEFYSAVIEQSKAAEDRPRYANCFIPSSQFIVGGNHDVLQLARSGQKVITFRAARQLNWHSMEHWGVWSSSRRSSLEFVSDLQHGDYVDVYFRLKRAPSSEALSTLIIDAGSGPQIVYVSENDQVFCVSGLVGLDGVISVSLLARGKYPSPGGRPIFVGLSGIAYCRQGDQEARNKLIVSIIPRGSF